jgi:cysteine desulfurase/selenocysteine lyase
MDIDRIREATAGCADKIFLNSAGASLMPHAVVNRMKQYLDQEELYGGYAVAQQHEKESLDLYTEIATLINCNAHNIAYAHSATEAYFRALSAIPFKSGDSIVTTSDDYISNQIAFLSLQKRFNIQIHRSGTTSGGDMDLQHLEELVQKHRPVLVAITHIPSVTGKIQDAASVGAICRKYNTWFLLDACQSCGQLTVDVKETGCDFLSATGRKFMRGPRGTGFLYISDKALDAGMEPLLLDFNGAEWTGKDQYKAHAGAKRFELFETSIASLLGFKEAVHYANMIGMENIYRRNQDLSEILRKKLAATDGVRVLDEGSHLSNIITFHMEKKELCDVEKQLHDANVYYSVSRKNAARIDFEKKGVEWAIRFSPHYFNTKAEMEQAADIVAGIK